jgi:arylsulfatase A-like enzyme
MVYPLPESRITLAEMLQEAGYNTVGMMSNVMIKSELQMTQGFDRVEEFDTGRFKLSVYRTLCFLGIFKRQMSTPDASGVTDKAIQWLDKMKGNPFFLFVHYMDTHHPYAPPQKYEELFRSSADRTEAQALFQKTKRFLEDPDKKTLSSDELKRLIDLYDASIRYVDEEIGRIIEEVESIQADRETIVIVSADHGDEFMEHGKLYHNNLLTEELIRVPLIMWSSHKRFERRRVDSLVRHIDVMPTVADWAGVEAPPEVAGVTLTPLIKGEEEFDLELIAEGAESTCLIYRNWKILHVDSTDSYYLYDLSVDSSARKNVSENYPEEYNLLKAKLREYMDRAEQAEAEQQKKMSPEMIEQLKALGYM